MEKLRIIILMALLGVMLLVSPVRAEMATMNEALTVARNWITFIIHNKGDWGGSETAEVISIEEFKRGERTIGYFCDVHPVGFIVVSLRKELAPVKAYSATCDLEPGLNEGMVDLIKGCMERILNGIEALVGPIRTAQTQDVADILEINYRPAWEELEVDSKTLQEKLESGVIVTNYQEGDVLLASAWHQREPYNDQCPNMGCIWLCASNMNALVGCVATAGAQIMRHWNWPPYGVGTPYNDSYDWPNIQDRYPGCAWVQAEVDAVAELCHEVGVAVGMTYGCGGSGAITADMEGVYENDYRYSTACTRKNRSDYANGNDWFNVMKTEFNLNRPVHYRILQHSIIGDGWQEIGVVPTRQYHMNYGWDNFRNTWYTLDALFYPAGGTLNDEYMLENIYPAQALGGALSGTYPLETFPYRYFDQDAMAMVSDVTFESGQYLQFLPGIKVTSSGGTIRFEGSSSNNTLLFNRGDKSRGIKIVNGVIKLYQNGSIKFE